MKKNPKYDADWKAGNRSRVREYLVSRKSLSGCSICDEARICCLVFNHRNPNNKSFNLSEGRDKAFRLIVEEAAKCDILCANCHAAVHNNKISGYSSA